VLRDGLPDPDRGTFDLADTTRELVRIPEDVHGPRAALPRPAANRDYADLRAQAWKPFISFWPRSGTGMATGTMIGSTSGLDG
jgi:hypothetical protein